MTIDKTIGNISRVWGRQNQRYPTLADHRAVAPRADVRLAGVHVIANPVDDVETVFPIA